MQKYKDFKDARFGRPDDFMVNDSDPIRSKPWGEQLLEAWADNPPGHGSTQIGSAALLTLLRMIYDKSDAGDADLQKLTISTIYAIVGEKAYNLDDMIHDLKMANESGDEGKIAAAYYAYQHVLTRSNLRFVHKSSKSTSDFTVDKYQKWASEFMSKHNLKTDDFLLWKPNPRLLNIFSDALGKVSQKYAYDTTILNDMKLPKDVTYPSPTSFVLTCS